MIYGAAKSCGVQKKRSRIFRDSLDTSVPPIAAAWTRINFAIIRGKEAFSSLKM